jgi:hypothetical protein
MEKLLAAAERCRQLYENYLKHSGEWNKHCQELAADEATLLAGLPYKAIFESDDEEKVQNAQTNIAYALGVHLLKVASALCAPPGGVPLEVNAEDFGWFWHNATNFDPQALVERFARRYGGTRGHDLGYQQCAQALIGQLNLQHGERLKVVHAQTNFELWVSTEPVDKNPGVRRLSDFSQKKFKPLLQALQVFLTWDGKTLDPAIDLLKRPVRSRELIALVPGALSVRTFYERYELLMSSELSSQLHVFLDRYGGEEWTAAA